MQSVIEDGGRKRRDSWSHFEPTEWRHPVSDEAETRQNTQISRTSFHDSQLTLILPWDKLLANHATRGFALFPPTGINGNVPFDQHFYLFGKITRLIRAGYFSLRFHFQSSSFWNLSLSIQNIVQL